MCNTWRQRGRGTWTRVDECGYGHLMTCMMGCTCTCIMFHIGCTGSRIPRLGQISDYVITWRAFIPHPTAYIHIPRCLLACFVVSCLVFFFMWLLFAGFRIPVSHMPRCADRHPLYITHASPSHIISLVRVLACTHALKCNMEFCYYSVAECHDHRSASRHA